MYHCNWYKQCVYVVTLQAEENLGMVMIFTLVTAVQEKLNEIVDVMKNRREEEKRRKEREAEEAEKVGTGKLCSLHTHTLFPYCDISIHTCTGSLVFYYSNTPTSKLFAM